MNLRHPRDGEMHFDLNTYFPDFHYRKAVEDAGYSVEDIDDLDEAELRTDGSGYADLHNGKRNAKLYYWLDPDTGSALEHTGVNDEQTIPFFGDEETAKEYLERRAENGDKEKYEGLSLYQARAKKVGDAVDVLTDQSGIDDFMPDGGYPESADGLQIDTPSQDKVWFWYDPSGDRLVQEEVEPYDVRGLFDTEKDAYRFADWYADRYGMDDTGHLELYSAEIEHEGQGRSHVPEGEPGDEREPPEQADLDDYTSDDDPELVTDGGLRYDKIAEVKLERALKDPIILHGPGSEAAPDPEKDDVYDKITTARLIQTGETPVEEPVEYASWPETLLYLDTVAFDGRYNTPEIEKLFRETFRTYVDQWTEYDLEKNERNPTLADPELSPELEESLSDLRRGIKQDRDLYFLAKADVEDWDGVPASFWDVSQEIDRKVSEEFDAFSSSVLEEYKL